MGMQADILGALARLKHRPAVDPVERANPSTLGELLALEVKGKAGRALRETRRLHPHHSIAYDLTAPQRQSQPARMRRGGAIAPSDLNARPRYTPAREFLQDDLELASLWAKGAVAWLAGRHVKVDLASNIAGPLAVIHGNDMQWRCPLVETLDREFWRLIGDGGFNGVMFDPVECPGLKYLAAGNAYVETYDLESSEEANPALLLLDRLVRTRGRGSDDFTLNDQEGLAEACSTLGLSSHEAGKTLWKMLVQDRPLRLPSIWLRAMEAVRAWGKATDGPWIFYGDSAECAAGSVDRFRKSPEQYFSFVAELLLARKKLVQGVNPLVKRVQSAPQKFWRELARSLVHAAKTHPKWNIRFETPAGAKKAQKAGQEEKPRGRPLAEIFSGPGAGGCPPPRQRVRAL
jgi:hypothetical protein